MRTVTGDIPVCYKLSNLDPLKTIFQLIPCEDTERHYSNSNSKCTESITEIMEVISLS